MNPAEYHTIYAAEDRHWWYVGMRRITLALLDDTYGGRADLSILDAGGGTGGTAVYLGRYGRVTAIDLSPLALDYCRARGLPRLGRASVTALPFAAGSFDLVTSFDVLYHRAVGDPRDALREFQRVLRPGGRLLLRLPAYDRLRGRHDAVIHTARRFSARPLAESLHEVGFAVRRLTYANTLLFPVALVKRLLERQTEDSDHSDVNPQPGPLNGALTAVLSAEAGWLRRRDLPFGLTVVALAERVADL
jgi:SAM-dependent methyltransferase